MYIFVFKELRRQTSEKNQYDISHVDHPDVTTEALTDENHVDNIRTDMPNSNHESTHDNSIKATQVCYIILFLFFQAYFTIY